LMAKHSISDTLRRAKWAEVATWGWPKDPGPPRWWSLSYHPLSRTLFAAHSDMPAWVMGLEPTGEVRWVELLSHECCNFRCHLLGDDVIAHVSSCGRRVT